MNFQHLVKIEKPDAFLDMAFNAASKQAGMERSKKVKQSMLDKSRRVELVRLSTVSNSLIKALKYILESFPSIDNLDIFYQELIKTMFDYVTLKKSLGAIKWVVESVDKLNRDYSFKIKRARSSEINNYRKEFYGRVASVVKQIKKELAFLEEARKEMKNFPAIKTGIDTVIIAGFPNVGKSTLLKAITGSDPKIASFPFTTQNLMMGTIKETDKKSRIQFIDTPGLLDRPFKKRNIIEKQAILAIRHLAKLILFIFDVSEECGYTVVEQEKLFSDIKKEFRTNIITVINKSEISNKEDMTAIKKKHKDILLISAKENKGIDELVAEIKKKFK